MFTVLFPHLQCPVACPYDAPAGTATQGNNNSCESHSSVSEINQTDQSAAPMAGQLGNASAGNQQQQQQQRKRQHPSSEPDNEDPPKTLTLLS